MWRKPDVQANGGHWTIIKLISFPLQFPQTSLPFFSLLPPFPMFSYVPTFISASNHSFSPPLIHKSLIILLLTFPSFPSPTFSPFPFLSPLIPYPFSSPSLSSLSLNSFQSLLQRLEPGDYFISFPERTAGYQNCVRVFPWKLDPSESIEFQFLLKLQYAFSLRTAQSF